MAVNQVPNSKILATTASVLPNTPSPSQASPLTPAPSPTSTNNVITTVLEAGIQQQQSSTNDPTSTQHILDTLCVTTTDNITMKTLPTSLNEISSIVNSTVSLPEVDHFIDTLHNLTSRPESNGLDSVSAPLHLDPVVSINEDSSSELLASIMGLTTNTQTLSTLPDTHVISGKSEGHVQELSTGIAGCCSVSFSTTSLIDMLSRSNAESVSTVPTCTTTTTSLFNENTVDGFPVNTSEKGYLSPPNAALFTSPQTSPIRITSPTPDHQWFNGEVRNLLNVTTNIMF